MVCVPTGHMPYAIAMGHNSVLDAGGSDPDRENRCCDSLVGGSLGKHGKLGTFTCQSSGAPGSAWGEGPLELMAREDGLLWLRIPQQTDMSIEFPFSQLAVL